MIVFFFYYIPIHSLHFIAKVRRTTDSLIKWNFLHLLRHADQFFFERAEKGMTFLLIRSEQTTEIAYFLNHFEHLLKWQPISEGFTRWYQINHDARAIISAQPQNQSCDMIETWNCMTIRSMFCEAKLVEIKWNRFKVKRWNL